MEIQLKNMTRPGSRTSILGSPTSEYGNPSASSAPGSLTSEYGNPSASSAPGSLTSEYGNLGNSLSLRGAVAPRQSRILDCFVRRLAELAMTTGIIGIAVFALGAKTASASVLPKPSNNLGLVGYWSFDDATGTKATDFSGQGRTGTLTNFSLSGATSTWVTGKKGKALNFDGSNDYVDMGTAPDVDYITISAWIKPTVAQHEYIVSSARDMAPVAGGYHLLINGGSTITAYIWLDSDNTNLLALNGPAPTLNEWQHVAMTYNGTSLVIYKNGVAAASTGTNADTISTPAYPLRIGTHSMSAPLYNFAGSIDDVRIYNRALSATEVAALYNSGAAKFSNPNNLGLVGYWSFDDATGTQAGDFSGHGGTASFQSTPSWTSGKRGGALSFNGSSDYLTVPHSSALNVTTAWTASAWVYLNDTPTNYPAIFTDEYPGSESRVQFDISFVAGRTVQAGFYDAGWYQAVSNNLVPLSQWTFVTGVYDGSAGSIKIYLNGVLDNTATGVPNSIGTVTSEKRIGRRWDNADYVNGKIDEVRLYNRALSATEVAALYNSGAARINATTATRNTGNLGSGLVGHWTFDGQYLTTTTSTDTSGSGNDGTLNNSPVPTIGKLGQALNFDGTDDYVKTTPVTGPGVADQPYTFSSWVNVASGETSGNIILMSSGSDGLGWCLPPLSLSGSKFKAYSWNGGGVTVLGTTVAQEQTWYHVATTWDSANGLRIFVNGALENSTAQSTYSASGSNNYLWFGFTPNGCAGNEGWLSGKIDDVRVYNRALSAAEVLQLYNQGK